ncbi:MFS transporter [Nocardioides litoris]|uniref:MFS transporter n=1 Tax=Nocardioides litoris TaxID=1926648 RepID=UPI001FE6B723|nr:MFS transporter [Nocardioides litoris]
MGVTVGRRGRVVDVVAPRRLGTPFRWLLASSWTSNLGDGIAVAAGPLLVAAQTDSAFLVSMAAAAVWAPALLVGLHAGVVTDRVDRRRIVVAVDLVRVAVLVVLTASILTDTVSIAVVLVALLALGTAETFADNASAALLPMLVARDDLAVANARLQTGFLTVNQLAGPPLGAALFAAGAAWAFGAQAVLVLLGAVLVARVAAPTAPRAGRSGPTGTSVRHEIAEGLRWLWHHAAVRTLAIVILVFNVTYGAAWSVLVLYATERLGLGEVGFGLVTTVTAAGGLLGIVSYGWITRHLSLGDVMRVGLVIETLTHAALALTTSAWVALPVFFVFGAHAFVWGTTSTTVRQRAVPTELQGRVGAAYRVAVFGGLVVGAGVGGVLAQVGSVTTPFWFAFAGSAVLLVLVWPQLSHIAHADDTGEPAP